VAGFLACSICAASADAHPIVSTDINRHVTLRVTDDRLEIRYIYELLEIAAINTARTGMATATARPPPQSATRSPRTWARSCRATCTSASTTRPCP
jgi:hypothetical protein